MKESADGQLSRITPPCADTVVRMRMGADDFPGTLRLGWQTGVNISPETCGQPIGSLSVSSEASHASSLSAHICSQSPQMRLSEHESRGKLGSLCPGAHLNAACSVRADSQLPSEESLLWEMEMSRAIALMRAAAAAAW